AILWLCALPFFFQAEDGIRDRNVTGVQTCALPIWCSFHERLTTNAEIRFYLVHHMFCFFYTPFWIKRDRNPSEHHGCEKHFKECRFIIDQNGYFLSLFYIFTCVQIRLNVTNGVIQLAICKYILSIDNRFFMWLLLCNLSYVEANAHM